MASSTTTYIKPAILEEQMLFNLLISVNFKCHYYIYQQKISVTSIEDL